MAKSHPAPAGPTLRTGSAGGALPVLGHLLHFRTRPLEFLTSLPAHGDLVAIRLGRRKALVLCHPHLAQQVLVDGRSFEKGGPFYEKLRPLGGDGLGTSPRDEHREQRRLMQYAFQRSRMPEYGAVMAEVIEEQMARWREGRVTDIHDDMHQITIQVVARGLFRQAIPPETVTEMRGSLKVFVRGFYRNMIAPFGFRERIPLPATRRYRAALRQLHGIAADMVAERGRDLPPAGAADDLLTTLLTAGRADGAVTPRLVHDQVVTLLTAGGESNAAVLAWAFHLLGAHPETERRLHAEVDSVLTGGRAARWEDLPRLPLAGRIITETLRLYPPGWLLTRVTVRPVELAGTRVEPGTIILFSPYVLHHRPDLFPDPERFDPGRWETGGPGDGLPPGACVPFGAGARKCIGDDFAITEAVLALASIAARWRFRPLPGFRVRPAPEQILHPERMPMRPEPRPHPTPPSASAPAPAASASAPPSDSDPVTDR
ncbi:cytochrome P450 [Streptomyces sp. NPDC000594]|uniref:cytochrome P450 n=1 Tax=Streptomyces sp. NPDC000594 TaxID=3154261 RepID=UPI00331C2AD7